jgi:hypothetical protein
MFLTLLFTSFASGIIATFVMLVFQYLPTVWGGDYFDALGAVGSLITKRVDPPTRFLGGAIYFAIGIIFALLYGEIAYIVLRSGALTGGAQIGNLPLVMHWAFPMLGFAIGLGHGIFVALLATVLIIEHHPLRQFHSRFILVISTLIGHAAFGITVMFFQSKLLQLTLGIN